MAFNIINKYEEIKSSINKKALVILNIRHAYKVHSHYDNGAIQQNTGKYLSDYFGNQAFFVLSNRPIFYTKENKLIYELIQGGKWDAAFKFLKIDNTGLDLSNSIFGNDNFDLQRITNVNKYNDVFDGFVFYKNIENHNLIDYYEGLISKDFENEFLRRYTIFFKYMENERFLKMLKNEESIERIIKEFNTKRYRKYSNYDFLLKNREKYLTD